MRQTLPICTLLTLWLMFSLDHASGAEPPKEITNSIGMKFRLIPAGEFMMGSAKSPEDFGEPIFDGTPFRANPFEFQEEYPQHKVLITLHFYLGVTEVTQEQYEKVMGKNPSAFSKTGTRADEVKGTDTSSFPVENVSWDDAVEFCRKLSAKEGKTYRLPTEAEWECACHAGTTTRYCFGDDAKQLSEYAWFGDMRGKTHPVGKKKPNAWGLYDMHGNVWERCQDWYGVYPSGTVTDPQGPSTGLFRVYRGGGGYYSASLCRSAARYWNRPDYRYYDVGFRVAAVPSGQ